MKLRTSVFPLSYLFGAPLLWAVPVANPDSYPAASENTPLVVDSANGVLSNDTPVGAITAVLESDVSNGSLQLNADGSFTYTPNPNFNGTDSFTYRASESGGAQVFTIDQTRSSATVDADLSVSGIGSDSDDDTTRLKGTVTALVTPSESPFSEIHITDFDVKIAESVSLNFRFAFGLAGVNANAAAESLQILMENPGPPSPVAGDGGFSQLDNEVRLIGTVAVEGTGLAAGVVPEGDQMFDSTGEFLDLNGTLTQSGSTLTLSAPIVYSGAFDLDGNALQLDLAGNLVATSPVQMAELSSPVTVTIIVAPRDSDDDGMDDSWEEANGLTVGVDDSAGDDDGDRRTNLDEFIALTDPQDPQSLLKIVSISQVDGEVTVSFTSTPGKGYQLQYSTDLAMFEDVDGAQLIATGAQSSFTVTPPSPVRGHYRILVQ